MKRLLILSIPLLFIAHNVMAQQYDTRGFSIGAHVNGTVWQMDDDEIDMDAEGGGGLGITAAYGVSNLVELFITADGANIDPDERGRDDYTMTHVDLGVRFNLGRSGSRWRPYLGVAATGREVEFEQGPLKVETDGGAITFLGGFKYFLSRPLALDVNLSLSGGEIDEVRIGGVEREVEVDAGSARLGFGITWYPNR